MKCKKSALWLACVIALAGVACKNEKQSDITVYIPDGAPALAMSKLLSEDTESDGVSYFVVPPAKIATVVAYENDDKNADICALPVTLASKKLGSGEKYRMLGTLTRGNLYILGRENVAYTAENLSELVGKTVGVIQLSEVPGLTFKAILCKYGVPWQEYREGVEKSDTKVNLQALSGADAIGSGSETEFWVAGEPAVSLQLSKGLYRVGDLQALYGDGYTQAVLVAKTGVIENRSEWLQSFLSEVKSSTEWVLAQEGAKLVSAVTAHLEDKNGATTLKAPLLTYEALAHCGIAFRSARDCKVETQSFLQSVLTVNAGATALAEDAFYYDWE